MKIYLSENKSFSSIRNFNLIKLKFIIFKSELFIRIDIKILRFFFLKLGIKANLPMKPFEVVAFN